MEVWTALCCVILATCYIAVLIRWVLLLCGVKMMMRGARGGERANLLMARVYSYSSLWRVVRTCSRTHCVHENVTAPIDLTPDNHPSSIVDVARLEDSSIPTELHPMLAVRFVFIPMAIEEFQIVFQLL